MNKVYLLLLLLCTSVFAKKRVETSIDTTKNKIGAEFKLTVKASVDTLSKLNFQILKHQGSRSNSVLSIDTVKITIVMS
jgi:hypothetical protein